MCSSGKTDGTGSACPTQAQTDVGSPVCPTLATGLACTSSGTCHLCLCVYRWCLLSSCLPCVLVLSAPLHYIVLSSIAVLPAACTSCHLLYELALACVSALQCPCPPVTGRACIFTGTTFCMILLFGRPACMYAYLCCFASQNITVSLQKLALDLRQSSVKSQKAYAEQ